MRRSSVCDSTRTQLNTFNLRSQYTLTHFGLGATPRARKQRYYGSLRTIFFAQADGC
ncbi:MAG: hypothetical protein H7Z11_03155 [Verrucomicrobia bacterium]|nr:hypothetical protein [Leptolyngbya sp. ES-bin-22]